MTDEITALEEELQEGEYEQPSEEIETEEKPLEGAKEKSWHFRHLKKFGNKINQTLLDEIVNSPILLTQIAELVIDSIDDDDLYNFVKPLYPNLTPIIKPIDRELMLKMLYAGSQEYLASGGLGSLNYWLNDYADIGFVRKNNDEIMGMYAVKHDNKFACAVIIMIRGGFKDRAKTAKEMVRYWGSTYAKMIHSQGYKYALSVTLTERHAALVQRVKKEELKLLTTKLKTELTDIEAEKKALKSYAGFHSTGSILPRQYEGRICWEKHWKYDLEAKFGK